MVQNRRSRLPVWADADTSEVLISRFAYVFVQPPGSLYQPILHLNAIDGSFELFNSLVSPWHQWLDVSTYSRHVASIEAMAPTTIASAHGPVLRGESIPRAFDKVRAMAGRPNATPPGQETLDAMLAHSL